MKYHFVATAILASVVAAPPEGKGFTVPLTINPTFKPNGKASYAHALAKYDQKPILPGTRGLKDGQGEVPLVDVSPDLEYLGEVEIGIPPKKFMLDFDSGSADLWVFSTLLPNYSKITNHSIYDPTKSSAYKGSNLTWAISYGDGSSSSGKVAYDTVNIGGVNVENQAVELASTVSDEFVESPGDGLLGLAFSSINTANQTTPFDNMVERHLIDQPVFAVKLIKHAPVGAGKGGSYTFGYLDDSAYTGKITYAPLSDAQFWQFSVKHVRIGKSVRRVETEAIVDTGTTLVLTDAETVKAYYKKIKGAKLDTAEGGYTVPCKISGPDFFYQIGSTYFGVPVSDVAYAPIKEGSSTCFGGIQDKGDIDVDILGDVFLKNWYVIFDSGNKQIGVAARPDVKAPGGVGNDD